MHARFSEGFGKGTAIGGLSHGAEDPESIRSAIETCIAPVFPGADPVQAVHLMTEGAVDLTRVTGAGAAHCRVPAPLPRHV